MLKCIFWILLAINIAFATTIVYSNQTQKNASNVEVIAQEKIQLLPMPENLPLDREATAKKACIEVGVFDSKEADSFEKKLALPSDKVNRIITAKASSYMVYIPPQKNPKIAEKRIAELQAKGINNYFLIQDGKFQHAISLGIFKTETSARKLLDELVRNGIHDAMIAGRGKTTDMVSFELGDLENYQLEQIDQFLATHPQITKKDCHPSDQISP